MFNGLLKGMKYCTFLSCLFYFKKFNYCSYNNVIKAQLNFNFKSEYDLRTTIKTVVIYNYFPSGTLFSISIFSDFMKLDDTVVGIISCTSKILASFIFAFASTTTEIYIGKLILIIFIQLFI